MIGSYPPMCLPLWQEILIIHCKPTQDRLYSVTSTHLKPSWLRHQVRADVTWDLQEMHILPAKLGIPNGPRDVCSVKRFKSKISRQDKAAKVQMWIFRHLLICNILEVCFLLILVLHLTNCHQSTFSMGFDCEIKNCSKGWQCMN